ncbi:MAG TPA: hypothetical protein VKR58_04280 [Aquella sp.]|nr:hypothetical protein [Aquella sp.]
MSFDPTKPVQTIDGYPARILCDDLKGYYPICAAVLIKDEFEEYEDMIYFTNQGKADRDRYDSSYDLINIPAGDE